MKKYLLRWVCPEYRNHTMLTLVSDPLDTTVRIRFPLKKHSNLTTPQDISIMLSRFGATDESSIVLSTNLKGKQEKAEKAPKTGSALVAFKQIGDAFAAVCASERKDSNLDGIKINWVRGEEPAILEWLRKMGKLNRPSGDQKQSCSTMPGTSLGAEEVNAEELPRNQSNTSFSTFPSSFVCPFFSPLCLLPNDHFVVSLKVCLPKLQKLLKLRCRVWITRL